MKPLSVLYYCKNNKRKVLTVVFSISACMFLIYFLQILKDSIEYSPYHAFLDGYKNYSVVVPSTSNQHIDPETLKTITQYEYCEKVIPADIDATYALTVLGGDVTAPVYSLRNEDTTFFMNKFHMTLKEGRLPREGTNEIALHYQVAKNRNKKIGQKMGHLVDKTEPLKGEYVIVGLLNGDHFISLTRTNFEDRDNLLENGILVFHPPDRVWESNCFLGKIPENKAKAYTYHENRRRLQEYNTTLDIFLNTIVIVVISVLALSIGNSSYIHTFHRRNELGLLYSLGFSKRRVTGKVLGEIILMNLVGYLAGFLITVVLITVINLAYFEPSGFVVRFMIFEGLMQTLAVPAFTILFSVIPVSRLLGKIDPVSIVEGAE